MDSYKQLDEILLSAQEVEHLAMQNTSYTLMYIVCSLYQL